MDRLVIACVVGAAAPASLGADARFSDQTQGAGLIAPFKFGYLGGPGSQYPTFPGDLPHMMCGGAVGDFNADGWPDLFVLGGGLEPERLFINGQDGTFQEAGEAWGVRDFHAGSGAAVGDYNNDGWPDIYVTSWGDPLGPPEVGRHLLYRNNGDGTFTDVALGAGVKTGSPVYPTGHTPCWGDFDLDGDLDLAVAGWHPQGGSNCLFRNEGDGTFSTITHLVFEPGETRLGFTPRFTDMDGDLRPELLWVADFRGSRYYVNQSASFTDQTPLAGVGRDQNGMGSAIGDLNRDGLLDWMVTSIYRPFLDFGNALYINQGAHSYKEQSRVAGVTDGGWGWGVVMVDVNHDGWLDILQTNGWIEGEAGGPDHRVDTTRVWISSGQNNPATGIPEFTDVALASGVNHTGIGKGLVRFDYDLDGDQDFVVFDSQRAVLYRNDLVHDATTRWILILCDTSDAADLAPQGFGTRVTVKAGGAKHVGYVECNVSYLGNSEAALHFGLRSSSVIDEIRADWANGTTSVLTRVPSNQTITLEPPEAGLCHGDADGSGQVDAGDVIMILSNWLNEYGSGIGPGDANADGKVDFTDITAVLDNWQGSCA